MKKILLISLAVLLLAACNKKVTELPPATQTGANTFGAMVNGAFWVPKGFGSFPANDILEVRFLANMNMYINANDFSKSPTEKEFEIFVQNVTGPGTYMLNTNVTYPSASANYAYYVKRTLTPVDEWITSSQQTGSVTITKFDIPNHIVSGTFQFNLVNLYDPSKTMTVTDGRFDIRIP